MLPMLFFKIKFANHNIVRIMEIKMHKTLREGMFVIGGGGPWPQRRGSLVSKNATKGVGVIPFTQILEFHYYIDFEFY